MTRLKPLYTVNEKGMLGIKGCLDIATKSVIAGTGGSTPQIAEITIGCNL
jgi:hypothetical protein